MHNRTKKYCLSLGLIATLAPGLASATDVPTCAAPVISIADRQVCVRPEIRFTSNANRFAVGLSVDTLDPVRIASVANRGFDRQRLAIPQCTVTKTSVGPGRSQDCLREVAFHQSTIVRR